jgi:UDP-N-acetylglucosamine 1-carboxyvinyltransferase
VVATDIRAGAALILAGLCAEGQTEISGASLVDRGYEDITGKLKGLGAQIEMLPEADSEITDAECLL